MFRHLRKVILRQTHPQLHLKVAVVHMELSQSSAALVRIRSCYLDEHWSIRARDSSLELSFVSAFNIARAPEQAIEDTLRNAEEREKSGKIMIIVVRFMDEAQRRVKEPVKT